MASKPKAVSTAATTPVPETEPSQTETVTVPATTSQAELFEGESDDVLFLDPDQLRSRFTATTVDRIEMKRNWIIDLISTGMPPEKIAARTKSDKRTVLLIGAKHVQAIASNIPQMAQYMKQMAIKAVHIAGDKLETAKVGELAIFAGTMLKGASDMEAAAAGVTEDNITEVEQVSPELASVREFLKKKPTDLTTENTENTEKPTTEKPNES